MQSALHFADIEIRILPPQASGYPLEFTVNHEQEFAGGFLQPQQWVPSASPEDDGRRLAQWLFASDYARSAWHQICGQYPQRRLRLRITAEAPGLHSVPWELLLDSDSPTPDTALAATAATPFSRYLAGQWRPGSPILQRPVKVLVAIANPADLTDRFGLQPVDIEGEMARLRALTDSLEVALVPLPQPCTLVAIEEALRQGTHILHLIAHGQHRAASAARDETSVLYLANDDNQTELVHAGDFAAMLARQLSDAAQSNEEKLRLVFLASCESAKRSSAAAFRGFAPQLVQAGVPAVVAMQDLIPVATSRQFPETFYTGLLRHGQVDLAANAGRSAVLSAKLPGAAIPVLFMRLRSGQLFGARGRVVGDDADSFWQLLLESIADDRCTPFIGPGVHRDLLPSPEEIALRLAETYNYPFSDRDNLPRVAQFVGSLDIRQLRSDLQRHYREGFRIRMNLPAPPDAGDQANGGKKSKKKRRSLEPALSELIRAADWSTHSLALLESELHHQLAALELPLYVTTNSDNFMLLALEAQGLRARRERLDPPEAGRHYALSPPVDPEEPVVFHLFGTDEVPSSLVVTQDEHLDFLTHVAWDDTYLPTDVRAELASNTLLFLGYRFEDLDLKVILRGVLAQLNQVGHGRIGVAVQIEDAFADPSKEQEVVNYFRKYFAQVKVDVYWGSTHQFVADLHARWQAY